MSQTDQTAEQVADSVTGFDEIAIAQHFGRTIGDLAQKDVSMFLRALVFVVKRRDGASDDAARNAALEMRMGDCGSFFAETSEVDEGKGEPPVTSPEGSLTSVS